MKRIFALMLAMCLFAFCAAAEDDFDYEDGNPALAPEISLPANPTTGYQWTFEVDDPCLDVTDHGFFSSDPDLTGAGGTHGFRLNGAQAGYAEAVFTYGRAWEESPIQVLTLRVIIDEDLNVMIYEFDMQ